MGIKVIAQRRVLKIGKNPGVKKFAMRPDLYIPIQEKKVFKEASVRSGVNKGVMQACWDAAGEVIKARTSQALACFQAANQEGQIAVWSLHVQAPGG